MGWQHTKGKLVPVSNLHKRKHPEEWSSRSCMGCAYLDQIGDGTYQCRRPRGPKFETLKAGRFTICDGYKDYQLLQFEQRY